MAVNLPSTKKTLRVIRKQAPESGAAPGDRGARYIKKGRGVLRQRVRQRYAFIKSHRHQFRVRTMCRVLDVHRSGYYAWLRSPVSVRAQQDKRQTGLIKQAWL